MDANILLSYLQFFIILVSFIVAKLICKIKNIILLNTYVKLTLKQSPIIK